MINFKHSKYIVYIFIYVIIGINVTIDTCIPGLDEAMVFEFAMSEHN